MNSYKRITLILLCLTLLTACGSDKHAEEKQSNITSDAMDVNAETETNSEKTETDMQVAQEEEPNTESMEQDTEDKLSLAKADLSTYIAGRLQDNLDAFDPDAFCDWFIENYGEESLLEWYAYPDIMENELEQQDNIWYSLTNNTFHALCATFLYETNPNAEDLSKVYFKDCADTSQTVLDFTGDINFAEDWYTTEHMDAKKNGVYDVFSKELRQEMLDADILVVNNEFVYSDRGEAIEGKAYCYRAKPERVKNLTILGVDLAGLANNHACDFGPEALLDTFDILREEGIPYVGAGANLDEAMQPVYFVANGRKIAIVAATQIERSYNYTKQATDTTPGVLKTLNPEKFVSVIEKAKANSDLVIVFVHWGTEKEEYYQDDQLELARAFVDAGADAIIGGHTHCLEGIKYVDDIPVFFSLGNFWQSKRGMDTGIAQVIVDENGQIACRFLPCIQENLETELVMDTDEKKRIWNYMESISSKVSIDEDGYIHNLRKE